MNLLSPLALLWLGSVPVLIWLWRHAASHQETRIPSLVPFEHLLRRTPQRRTRLLINLLFWLQLACLALTILALAQPVLLGRRARTTLVIVDTSASMNASLGGSTPMQQAKSWLLSRLARKDSRERWFVMTSAPVTALTAQPTGDTFQLRQLIEDIAPSDLAGHLSMAARIGRGLAGEPFSAILVVTDEPAPGVKDPAVEVQSFGKAVPNVAIVGVDASAPLCVSADSGARLLVLVHNFSEEAQSATVTIRRDGHDLTRQAVPLAPSARASVALDLPAVAAGVYDVRLSAPRDALAVDDRALIELPSMERIPVAIASAEVPFVETIARWLDACPRLAWRRAEVPAPSPVRSELLITDQPDAAMRWPGGSVVFMAHRERPSRAALAHWLVDPTHPLGSYLEPVETVAASLAVSIDPAPSGQGVSATEGMPIEEAPPAGGTAVVWGVIDGRRVPLIIANDRGGRRRVMMRFDPSATPTSVPVVLVFLNSLRWLAGAQGMVTTGQSLAAGPFEAAPVRIQRPDGREEVRTAEGGVCRDDATDRTGRYRFIQGTTTLDRFVNFFNPVESNTMQRVSTWAPEAGAVGGPASAQPSREPLASWLIGLCVVVWLVEWWLYSRRRS